MNTEIYAYLARKTSWSRKDLQELHPTQLLSFYNEVVFQELQEEWRNQNNIATVLAAIYNTIPRKRGSKSLTAKDFFDVERPTKQEKKKDVITELAETVNIKLPEK